MTGWQTNLKRTYRRTDGRTHRHADTDTGRRRRRTISNLGDELDMLTLGKSFECAIEHALSGLRMLPPQLELAVPEPNLEEEREVRKGGGGSGGGG